MPRKVVNSVTWRVEKVSHSGRIRKRINGEEKWELIMNFSLEGAFFGWLFPTRKWVVDPPEPGGISFALFWVISKLSSEITAAISFMTENKENLRTFQWLMECSMDYFRHSIGCCGFFCHPQENWSKSGGNAQIEYHLARWAIYRTFWIMGCGVVLSD